MGKSLIRKRNKTLKLSVLISRKGELPWASVVVAVCSPEAGKTVEMGRALLMQVKTRGVGEFFQEQGKAIYLN